MAQEAPPKKLVHDCIDFTIFAREMGGKRMRKTVSVLLVCMLVAVLMLSGCAKKTGTTTTGPIQIALQAPITGDYAFEGQMAKQSVEVATELINNAGGVLGRQIAVTVVDDGSNPKDSAIAAQKAVSMKAVAVIGSYGYSVTQPAADIYEKNKMVDVGYGCTAVGRSEEHTSELQS